MALTLLIVDDKADNLRILSDLLIDDYRLLIAKTGKHAIDQATNHSPDLILLDVIMPDMTGFDVIKELKSSNSTKDIPIIFVTGLDSSEHEVKGLELGAVDYIYKPFNPVIVRARISTQIKLIEQNKQLSKLSSKLERSLEAKSRFLANMSHEIRTPLATIIGYTETILNGEIPDAEQLNAIQIINDSGIHLLSLINDILDFSKIEAGQLNIELVPSNLIELIKQVQLMCKELIGNKDISLTVQIDNQIPEQINTDPTRLKQILINLTHNAIKFTEQGSVFIQVKCTESHLMFKVVDTGIGIANEKVEKLFAPFHQAEDSTTRRFGGTGLGLSISRSLAKKLGGEIKGSSEQNKGSEFIASIALHPQQQCEWIDQAGYEQYQHRKFCLKSAANRYHGKVLLAEDEPHNRRLFEIMLDNFGLDVTAVENGKQMLETALAEDFDLIVSDVQMPEISGQEAMQLLRGSGIMTPVIALTANVMKHEVAGYIEAGFNDHLAKPVSREALIAKLDNYCQRDDKQTTGVESNPPNSSNDQFLSLKNKFKTSLAEYREELCNTYNMKDYAKLAGVAHKLKGTAGTFDFDEISAQARELENEIIGEHENIEEQYQTLIELIDNI